MSTDYFKQPLLDACGFFSIFSFVLSVYALMASSVDRFVAVRWPIEYKMRVTPIRRMTVALIAITWSAALLIALVPLITPKMRYALGLAWMVLAVPDKLDDVDDNLGSQGYACQDILSIKNLLRFGFTLPGRHLHSARPRLASECFDDLGDLQTTGQGES